MWNVVGIALILAGAALIYSVLVKKFPQLKLIDLSTLARERHAEVKSRIMKTRFDRSLGALRQKTSGIVGRASSGVWGAFERAYGSLKRMESKADGGPRSETVLPSGRDAAEAAQKDGRYEEAERQYILALKTDPRDVEAYRGLADLYIGQKLYDQAAETLEFLLRLTGDDDRALGRLGQVEASRGDFERAEARYLRSIELAADATAYRAELGKVYLAAGDARRAYEQFRTALQSEPHHPKYLDYFLEASILVGDRDAARSALSALSGVNPGNAKLEEFRARIEALREKV